jgi:hypothetical protein
MKLLWSIALVVLLKVLQWTAAAQQHVFQKDASSLAEVRHE